MEITTRRTDAVVLKEVEQALFLEALDVVRGDVVDGLRAVGEAELAICVVICCGGGSPIARTH